MKPEPRSRPAGIRRIVQVCAWCPPAIVRAQTAALHRMGHCVSHGICPACAAHLRGEPVPRVVTSAIISIMPSPTAQSLARVDREVGR